MRTDAGTTRALRARREERENAKKAEAARKRAAVNARREAGQRQHDASTRPATRPPAATVPGPRPGVGKKRAYTCSVCRCQGHKARRKEGVAQCPVQQLAAALATYDRQAMLQMGNRPIDTSTSQQQQQQCLLSKILGVQ